MDKRNLHQLSSVITNFGIRIQENKAFADILTQFSTFVCCLENGTVQVQSPDGFTGDVPAEVLKKAKELLRGITESTEMS